jgi:hypothetical protein
MQGRKRLRDAIFSPGGPSANDLARLRALGRRVFVVYRMHEGDRAGARERFNAHSEVFRGEFATGEIAVWELTLD